MRRYNRAVEENYLGTMTVICEHCGACFFQAEVKTGSQHINVCCNFGNIYLPYKFPSYPTFIKELLKDDTPDGMNFRENIRQYNISLSMASMSAQFDILRGRGPYCFRIHGQVYIHPYIQIYILDTRQAAQERMNIFTNTNFRRSLMHQQSRLLTQINQYAQSFRMMAEVHEEEERVAALEGRNAAPIRMTLMRSGTREGTIFLNVMK